MLGAEPFGILQDQGLPGRGASDVRYAGPVLRQFYFWYGYRSEARTVARQVLH
jgi:hypothetical protein